MVRLPSQLSRWLTAAIIAVSSGPVAGQPRQQVDGNRSTIRVKVSKGGVFRAFAEASARDRHIRRLQSGVVRGREPTIRGHTGNFCIREVARNERAHLIELFF